MFSRNDNRAKGVFGALRKKGDGLGIGADRKWSMASPPYFRPPELVGLCTYHIRQVLVCALAVHHGRQEKF